MILKSVAVACRTIRQVEYDNMCTHVYIHVCIHVCVHGYTNDSRSNISQRPRSNIYTYMQHYQKPLTQVSYHTHRWTCSYRFILIRFTNTLHIHIIRFTQHNVYCQDICSQIELLTVFIGKGVRVGKVGVNVG